MHDLVGVVLSNLSLVITELAIGTAWTVPGTAASAKQGVEEITTDAILLTMPGERNGALS